MLSTASRRPSVARGELRRSLLSPVLILASKIPKIRRLCLWAALRFEGSGVYSHTARRIMADHYGITIGAYSYDCCFIPGALPEGITIGRYVSMATGVRIIRRNHPLNWLSTHPFFFNHIFGFVPEDKISFRPLMIEHDVWIGEGAIITAGCSRIGIGAVVGSGAVVTRDIPDFAVVGGVPARVIKFRFPEAIQRQILATRWWEHPAEKAIELAQSFAAYSRDTDRHGLLFSSSTQSAGAGELLGAASPTPGAAEQ